MISFLEAHGILGKEEDNGRMLLASNKAKELLDFLLAKNAENQNEIRYAHRVLDIEKHLEHWIIKTDQGNFESKRVIIACGGQSFPKVGGTDFIFDFAKKHQLNYHPSAPALCGLNTKEDLSSLSGSSLEAKTRLLMNGKTLYEDDRVVLFTHWGVS